MGFLGKFIKKLNSSSKHENLPRYYHADYKLKHKVIDPTKVPLISLDKIDFNSFDSTLKKYFQSKLDNTFDDELNAILLKHLELLSLAIFKYIFDNDKNATFFVNSSLKPSSSYSNYIDLVKFIQFQTFNEFFFDETSKTFKGSTSLLLQKTLRSFNNILNKYFNITLLSSDTYGLGIFDKNMNFRLKLKDKTTVPGLLKLEKKYDSKFSLFYKSKFGGGSYNRLPLKYHSKLKKSLDSISNFEVHFITKYGSTPAVIKFLKDKRNLISSYFKNSPLEPLIKFDKHNILLKIDNDKLLAVMDKRISPHLDILYKNLIKDFEKNHPLEKNITNYLKRHYSDFKKSYTYLSSYNLSLLSLTDIKNYTDQLIIFRFKILFLLSTLTYYEPNNNYFSSVISFISEVTSFLNIFKTHVQSSNSATSIIELGDNKHDDIIDYKVTNLSHNINVENFVNFISLLIKSLNVLTKRIDDYVQTRKDLDSRFIKGYEKLFSFKPTTSISDNLKKVS